MTRQIEMVDELLACGANLDAQRMDGALPIQLINGDYHFRGWRDVPGDHATTPRAMLDYLRFRGAFCDLRTAPHIGDLARVEELVDQDPSMVSRPSDYVTYYACAGTALRNAAAAGHREVVPQAGQFIDHGADVLARDEDICLTPLGWAAKFGRTATVRYLLQRGALPQLPDEPPWATPLAWAQRRNHPDIVHCLREAGNP